jgi:membrane protein DedA with SNARE-associated domain
MKKMGRMPLSIFMNISFLGFVLWVLLIFLLISFYQRDNCRTISPADVYDCPDIIEDLGFKFSFLLLGIGIVFNIIYTKIFMNWKAKSD